MAHTPILTPRQLARLAGAGADVARVFTIPHHLSRVLSVALESASREEVLRIVGEVLDALQSGKMDVEWGNESESIDLCHRPLPADMRAFRGLLGASGFCVKMANDRFSWDPPPFDRPGERCVPSFDVFSERMPETIALLQMGATCATTAVAKLLGKFTSASAASELLPVQALHAVTMREHVRAGKQHVRTPDMEDDVRITADVSAAESLRFPCHIDWLAESVRAVFDGKVALEKIAGVSRSHVTHAQTDRTETLPLDQLMGYLTSALAPASGKPCPLLLSVRSYTATNIYSRIKLKGAGKDALEFRRHEPWRPCDMRSVKQGIERSSAKATYDGHAVLAVGMFECKERRWVLLEDHHPIAGEEGAYAMDVTCLATITTDVWALRGNPTAWQAGRYADLFPVPAPARHLRRLPEDLDPQPPTRPAAFLADVGDGGRWCTVRQFFGRAADGKRRAHLLVDTRHGLRSVHVHKRLLNDVARQRWRTMRAEGVAQGGMEREEDVADVPETPAEEVENVVRRGTREKRKARAELESSRKRTNSGRAHDDRGERTVHEHREPAEGDGGDRAQQRAPPQPQAGVRDPLLVEEEGDNSAGEDAPDGKLARMLAANDLGILKADAYALPPLGDLPLTHRRERMEGAVEDPLRNFSLVHGLLHEHVGGIEHEERVYRVGSAVWMLEKAIKGQEHEPGYDGLWREVVKRGLIPVVLDGSEQLRSYLQHKCRSLEEKVTVEALKAAKNSYYYYVNASRAPLIRLIAQREKRTRHPVSHPTMLVLSCNARCICNICQVQCCCTQCLVILCSIHLLNACQRTNTNADLNPLLVADTRSIGVWTVRATLLHKSEAVQEALEWSPGQEICRLASGLPSCAPAVEASGSPPCTLPSVLQKRACVHLWSGERRDGSGWFESGVGQ